MIDRRVATNDYGGIDETMYLDFKAPLELHFRLKLHNYSGLSSSDAIRRRNLLASKSLTFTQMKPNPNLSSLKKYQSDLTSALNALGAN